MARRAAFLFSPGSATSAAVNISGVSSIRLTTGPTWTPAALKVELVPGFHSTAGMTVVNADGTPVIIPTLGPQQSVVLPPEASGGSFMRLVRVDDAGNPLPAPGSQMIVATLAGDLSLPWTFVSQELFGAPRTGGHEMIYLLRDDFLTAEAAPLTSPRTAEPGPGTLEIVDVEASFTISDGVLSWGTGETYAWNDYVQSQVVQKQTGLAALIRYKQGGSRYATFLGFSKDGYTGGYNISDGGFYVAGGGDRLFMPIGDGGLKLEPYPLVEFHDLICVLKHIGGMYFDGSRLLHVDHTLEAANNLRLTASNNNTNGFLDSLRVARLPGSPSDPVPGNGYEVFSARDLDVVDSAAAPAANDSGTMTPDSVIALTCSTPTGTTELLVRYSDATHYDSIKIDASGNLTYNQANGGTPAALITAAAVITGGEQVSAVLNGSAVSLYYNRTLAGTTSSASANVNGASWKLDSEADAVTNLTVRTLDGAYTYPRQGPELVENGGFDSSSAWNLGSGISINDGKAVFTASTGILAQDVGPLETGKYYLVRYDIDSISGGAIRARFGIAADGLGNQYVAPQSVSEIIAGNGTSTINLQRSSGVITAIIDNVSIIEVNPNASPNNPGPGLATDVLPGPVSAGDTFTHEADGRIEFDVDAIPPEPSGIILLLRKQSDLNYWRFLINQDGDIQLNVFVNGSGTQRAIAPAALSGGEHIVVVADGETIKAYYDNTLAWTYASAANFKTETAGEISSLGTGGRISNLVTYPVDYAAAPNTYGASEVLKALTKMATPSRPGSTLLFAPDDLVATYDYVDTVHLEWTDNNAYETGYVVERSSDGGATWDVIDTLPAGTESYDDVVGA